MKRKMTPLLARLYALARRHRLSFPLGRAAAAVNRHYNDGVDKTDRGEVALMKSFQSSTALRWETHWDSGGSLKRLTSRESQLADRRAREARLRQWMKEHG
jgi:hypothetical protein